MEFRTSLNMKPFGRRIDYSLKGLSLGSCFAQNIAERMRRVKLPLAVNPFGVLYNPCSIADSLETLAGGKYLADNDLVRCDDLWCSFAFHGSFSSPDPAVALDFMNRSIREGREALTQAGYVILTFGTAWVYELAGSDRVVANCHKFPASAFVRRRLGVAETIERYDKLLQTVLRDKHVILTVSPVRHLKDGFAGNSASKATLLLAADELASKYPRVDYFPAFEIVNDDLRDYRFYKRDMLHPSDTAVDYIWEYFCANALSDGAAAIAGEVAKIAAAAGHRPLNPETDSHREFCRSMLAKSLALCSKYPDIDLGAEIDHFTKGSGR